MPTSPGSRGVTELATAVRRAIDSPEPDLIHDLRVAIRRFLQVLAVYESAPKSIRDALKKMMRFAGDVRDCDITLKLVKKANASQRLLDRLHRRRGAAERVLLIELQKWIELNTASRWRERLTLDGRVDPAVLSNAVKRLFKRGARAEGSKKELHPLRIAAKKLRYTLELTGNVDAAHLEQVRGLQQRLGDINDYETAQRIAAEESASKNVLKDLRQRQDKKIRVFRKYWDQTFAGKKRKREWKVTLQSRARPMTVAPRRDAVVMKRA